MGRSKPHTGRSWALLSALLDFDCSRSCAADYLGSFFDDHEGYLRTACRRSAPSWQSQWPPLHLLVRMISRNQRAVDEATSWLKRIVITWIVLNSLGFIVAYLQPLISGGNYNP